MAKSNAEESFWLQLQAAVAASELPCLPEREYRFHPDIAWRLDFAWPAETIWASTALSAVAHKFADAGLAVEIDGGMWSQGRHTRGEGAIDDRHKISTALAWDWTVYTMTPGDLKCLGCVLEPCICRGGVDSYALRVVRYEFGEIERAELDAAMKQLRAPMLARQRRKYKRTRKAVT